MGAGDPISMSQVQPRLEVDANAVARDETGNTVDLETEILNLSENQIAHQLESKIVTGTLKKLRLAITGRPQ